MTIVNMVGGGGSGIEGTYNEYTTTTPYIAFHGSSVVSSTTQTAYITQSSGTYESNAVYKTLDVTTPMTLSANDYLVSESTTSPTGTLISSAHQHSTSSNALFGTNTPSTDAYYVWKGTGVVTSNTIDDYISGFLPDGTYNVTTKVVLSWKSTSIPSDHINTISTDYVQYPGVSSASFIISKVDGVVTIKIRGFTTSSKVNLFLTSAFENKYYCLYFLPTSIKPE